MRSKRHRRAYGRAARKPWKAYGSDSKSVDYVHTGLGWYGTAYAWGSHRIFRRSYNASGRWWKRF